MEYNNNAALLCFVNLCKARLLSLYTYILFSYMLSSNHSYQQLMHCPASVMRPTLHYKVTHPGNNLHHAHTSSRSLTYCKQQ